MYLGDNLVLDIVSHGSIRVKFSNGRIRRIDGVLLILGLERNLLSVSKLIDVIVHVQSSEADVKMVRGAMVIARGSRLGTLYQLDAFIVECNSTFDKIVKKTTQLKKGKISLSPDGHGFWVPKGGFSTKSKLPIEKTMLQHEKLNHIGEKVLRTLKNKNLVDGLNDCNLEFDFCEHCIYGKQNDTQFYLSSHKSSCILDPIHLDVFGPVDVPSIGRSSYYVSFIDYLSRRTCVYFLRSKAEVFSHFKEFKEMVEL